MFFEKSVKSLIQSIEKKVSENSLVRATFRTGKSGKTESLSRPSSGNISLSQTKTTESFSPSKSEFSKDKKLTKTYSTLTTKLSPAPSPRKEVITVEQKLTKAYNSEFTLIPAFDNPIVVERAHADLTFFDGQIDSDNQSANYSEISDITDTASWASSKKSFQEQENGHDLKANKRKSGDSFSTLEDTHELNRLKEFLQPICVSKSVTHYYIILLHGVNITTIEELRQCCKEDICFLINLGFDYIISRDITDTLLAGSNNSLGCRSNDSKSKVSRKSKLSSQSTVKEYKESSPSEIAKLYYNVIAANNREAFRDLKKLAEEQNSQLAKAYLMRIYALGQAGIEQNLSMAQVYAADVLHWLKAVSQDNHSIFNMYAKYLLGVCHAEGLVVPKNAKEAFLWYKQSAEQGYDAAQAIVGHCFYTGQGVLKDVNEAVKWYRVSAQQGFAAAQCNLGICYELGDGVHRDMSEAVKWYKMAADQGNCTAQYNLALSLECGTGIKHNQSESLKYYKKAAEQGHAAAQYKLGFYYFTESENLELLEEEAFYWLEKSTRQGNPQAPCQLGLCYERGIGTDANLEKAMEYYRLGSDKGDSAAMYHLAHCYYTGIGCEKDYELAIKFYTSSAEKGHPPAQNNLGYCYFAGTGVEQDYSQALRWYKAAAEHGYAQAQFNLGYCYEKGFGTPKKPQETIRWYRAAAAQGHAKAESALKKNQLE